MDTPAANGLDMIALVVGLLGGLSIFLYGMNQMTDALKAAAGGGMSTVLSKLTGNRFTAAITGAFVTGVIQSSSVTTVLVVGFISAGLMSLQQSVGVIMGANIGSTVTAQLIAFKITAAALPLITVGFAMLFVSRRDWVRMVGTMVMGLGMIFLGMGLMSKATYPLREFDPFIEAMRSIDRPVLAILASAVFTAIVQSSAATTGIVIVLAGQGFITLEAGIALALGSNIGTCATALLAALGKPRPALQAAVAHIFFNVAGVILWLPLIGLLATIVREISPGHADLEGTARMAAETPRQIANAHTFFNVANTVVFIWFTGPIAALVSRLVPVRPEIAPEVAQPLYLDEVYLETPALAIDRIRLECAHLGELVLTSMDSMGPDRGGRTDPETIAGNIADVTSVHSGIVAYAQDLLRESVSAGEASRVEDLLAVAGHLYSISDTIAVNVRRIAREARERGLTASQETQMLFDELHATVRSAVELAIQAVWEQDRAAAMQVVAMKAEVSEQADRLAARLSERLTAPDPNRIEIYRLESEVIEILKRLYYFAKRVAKIVAKDLAEPELDEERGRAA
jgi:phosphate:Na+ symporter